MLLGSGVSVLLGHTKINNVNDVGGFRARAANEKVVGFDITVDEVSLMDGLDSGQHLFRDHDHRFNGKSATTVIEQIL